MKELGFDKDIKSETVEENNNTVEKSSKKDKSNKKEKLNRDEKSSNNEKLSNKEKLSKKEKPNKNEKLKASKELKEEIKLEVKKVLKKEIIDFDVEEIISKVSLLDYNKNLLQECVPWHNKVKLFCLSFSRNNISPYHMFFS